MSLRRACFFRAPLCILLCYWCVGWYSEAPCGANAEAVLTANDLAPPPPHDALAHNDSGSSVFARIRHDALRRCRADVICGRRFFIDKNLYDKRLFYYLFDEFVNELEARTFLVEHYFSESTTNHESHALKVLWTIAMRHASFCGHNEVPTEEGSCTCRSGKTCRETDAQAFNIDSATLILLFLFIGVAIVYYSSAHLAQTRSFYRAWLRRSLHRPAAAAHT